MVFAERPIAIYSTLAMSCSHFVVVSTCEAVGSPTIMLDRSDMEGRRLPESLLLRRGDGCGSDR